MKIRLYMIKHKDRGVCWWDFLQEHEADDGSGTIEFAARITKVENTQLWYQVEFAKEPPAPLRKVLRYRELADAKKALLAYFSPALFTGGIATVAETPQPIEEPPAPPPMEQAARAYHRAYHRPMDDLSSSLTRSYGATY